MNPTDAAGADDPDAGPRGGDDRCGNRGPAKPGARDRGGQIPGRDLHGISSVRQGRALVNREADPQLTIEDRDHGWSRAGFLAGLPLSLDRVHGGGFGQAMRNDRGFQGHDGAAGGHRIANRSGDGQTGHGQNVTSVYSLGLRA